MLDFIVLEILFENLTSRAYTARIDHTDQEMIPPPAFYHVIP
jgi:hypothetical protein